MQPQSICIETLLGNTACQCRAQIVIRRHYGKGLYREDIWLGCDLTALNKECCSYRYKSSPFGFVTLSGPGGWMGHMME